MKFARLFVILFVLSDSCIERFELPDREMNPILVVDGLITNEPGPYYISLYYSHVLNKIVRNPEPVGNATINIFDDQGNSETLMETVKGGEYFTSATGIRGTLGRKYHITITTSDGKQYATAPQVMIEPGEITNLRYQVFPNSINRDDVFKPQHTVKFFIDARASSELSNYFRWRWTSTYEIKNLPEGRTKWISSRPRPTIVPDPPACSGVRVRPGSVQLEVFAPCTCCYCWVTTTSRNVVLSNNKFLTTQEFEDVLVATIPVDKRPFDYRFHMKVEQLALSEQAYRYWRLVQSQEENQQSLFVPNVIRMQGNVFNIAEPEEVVLGLFSASGVTSKTMFIEQRSIPFEVFAEEPYESCLDTPGSTNIRPDFW
ncbi:MAG TPA: DUF4249 domain-containing protein [Chryseosolibacter sp.]